MQSFGNIRTVYKLLTFRTRHKGNWTKDCGDPRLGKYVRSRQMRLLKLNRERKRRS